MTYEVELKFPISDTATVERKLLDLGAQRGPVMQQQDHYFAHPLRSFAETDEALRIRRTGLFNYITYKGPVIDRQTKTRQEIELKFEQGESAAEQFAEMLEILGFQMVRIVTKTRIPYQLTWENHRCELALDEVEGLGTFIELETRADDQTRDDARDAILKLANRLGLKKPERRSYLCLLLEQAS